MVEKIFPQCLNYFFKSIFTYCLISQLFLFSDFLFAESKTTEDRTEKNADRRSVVLAVGVDKVVDLKFKPFDGAKGLSIGNPEIVKPQFVSVGNESQIVFKPLKVGTTTVGVRDESGNLKLIFDVSIAGQDLEKISSELSKLFEEIEGLKISVIQDKVVLDGELYVPKDFSRIASVIYGENSPYKGLVLNLTQMSPVALKLLADRISQDISLIAPTVSVRVVNGTIWLEGPVPNEGVGSRVAQVALLYIPEAQPSDPINLDKSVKALTVSRPLIHNFTYTEPPPPAREEPQVRVVAHYVELTKNYNKIFGFKWQPGFTTSPSLSFGETSDGSIGSGGGPTFAATLSSLFPKLQSAQNAGYARVLKTTDVIVRSGQRAELTDQIDIPYAILGGNGQVTSAKATVGLALGVTPSVLGSNDDVRLDISLSQKNLVGNNGSDPIVSDHKVNTNVYVRNAETAALAAIRSSDVKTNFNQDDPNSGGFSGETSALFSLLRSKGFTKNRGQFVIFVTPQIVTSASEGTQDLKKNFRVRVN